MPLEQQLGTYILIYKQEVTKRKLTGDACMAFGISKPTL